MSGLDILVALERIRFPALNLFFEGITYLGAEEAYLLVFIVVYLCINRRLGFRLLMAFVVSAYVMAVCKELWAVPRPYLEHRHLLHPLALSTAEGYSMPSGHALLATVVWGYIALQLRSWRWRLIPVAVIALVSFSRVYLQVHWPADILVGLALGAALLGVYVKVTGWIDTGRLELSTLQRVAVVVVVAAAMYLLGEDLQNGVPAAGGLLGGGLGYLALRDPDNYREEASIAGHVLKVIPSVTLLLAGRYALRQTIGSAPPAQMLTYAGVAVTATLIIPVVIQRLTRSRSQQGEGAQ